MTETRVHGYIRVSSKDQNEGRQIAALKEFGIAERDIYIDKQSGKNFERPEYQRLLNSIRNGDLVVVLSIDRLGRNYTEVQEQWRYIVNELGADIKVLDMPLLDTRVNGDNIDTRFVSDLVLQILSYVAQKERENIKERQAQGIAYAKARGKHIGRPKAEYPVNWRQVYNLWHNQKAITAKEAMERTGLKRNTFYKLAAKYEQSKEK
ncbi:recombinase family protein [Massiliimalia massiliensis]|uniref:recombinase family protein n=1 Tax=Massiliimalia massiliensis TaxID=1852384 RepID=UPI0009878029|nr:recombinase family protein [Massiliimalia massiliensis]